MDMTLSKRGDYVMRAAIYLARSSTDAPRKIREVVAETEVPPAYASQILSDLVRAGIASSKAGRNGGYQLRRDPASITALEIVEAAEGRLSAERCALGDAPCKWDAVCPLHETWFSATQQLRELLDRTTLAEIAARDEAIENGVYVADSSHRQKPLRVDLSDDVTVECGVDVVRRRLVTIGSRASDLMSRALGVDGGDDSAPATVDVQFAALDDDVDHARFDVVWRVWGTSDASHAEAELLVTRVDDQRSHLAVDVHWHYESGRPDGEVDGHRVTSVVRSFLRELARELESGTDVA